MTKVVIKNENITSFGGIEVLNKICKHKITICQVKSLYL